MSGIEAMYGVEFVSNLGTSGYGVAIFETGRIFGGDSSFVYIGNYEIADGLLKLNVKVTDDRSASPSIFGNLHEFNLYCEGKARAGEWGEFTTGGRMVENQAMEIGIKFTRRAELP